MGTDANGNFGIYPYGGGGAGVDSAGLGGSITGTWANVTQGWATVANHQFVLPADFRAATR